MREFEGDAILGLLVAIVDSWSWRFQFVKSPDAILVGRGAGGKYPIWGCAEGVHRGSPTLIQFKGTGPRQSTACGVKTLQVTSWLNQTLCVLSSLPHSQA